jgi:RNA polymerase sigma factor (sigma-70 family)
MDETNAARKEDAPSKTLLDSLLPQICITVRWACRYYRRFPDQGVIDDLTQEITLSLIQNDCHALRSFEYRSTEKTWLLRVVLHRVGRYFKSQYPTESLEEISIDSLPSQPPSQELMVLFKERERLLETACCKLTVRERMLWDFLRSGLSDKEIAEQMSTTSNAIYQSKYKLIKKIQRLIEWEEMQANRGEQEINICREVRFLDEMSLFLWRDFSASELGSTTPIEYQIEADLTKLCPDKVVETFEVFFQLKCASVKEFVVSAKWPL